jgi:hypothetical protein
VEDKPEPAVTAVEEQPLQRKSSMTLGAFIVFIIMSIIVASSLIYVYDHYFAQKVVVLDIRGYIQDRKKMFLSGDISESEFTASVDHIENTLNKLSKKTIVISGDAIVRSSEKIKIVD